MSVALSHTGASLSDAVLCHIQDTLCFGVGLTSLQGDTISIFLAPLTGQVYFRVNSAKGLDFLIS